MAVVAERPGSAGEAAEMTTEKVRPGVGWLRRLWRWLTGADRPLTTHQYFARFFGAELLGKLETHEKQFPGYDLASLHAGLLDLFGHCCSGAPQELGSCGYWSVTQLLASFATFVGRSARPGQPNFQRVAVDVEEEISVASSGLFLAEMTPEAGARRTRRTAALRREPPALPAATGPEKLAILLSVNSADFWSGMETSHVAVHHVQVGVACRSRDVADRFFAELEERRRANSIFRGKVIDPVVHSGAVTAIAFRAIKQVREEDLVLPDEVKSLIQRSVVGFCKNRTLLERLAVDLKRGILLHGPPGTGKTSICLYLAGLLPDFTICFVSGDRLLYPREVCRMARYLQPAMVVFEDVDLIAQQRDANGLATVLGELMKPIVG
jgi:hypothetical protein